MAQLPKMISFSEKTIKLIFMYLMAPFICKISKKFLEWIQSYDEVPFQAMTNDPFAPNKTFFKKTINISFLCLLAPFIVQNLKKNPQSQSRVTRMSHFQAQNGLIVPNDNFFQKNRCKISIYLLAPFIVQNFKKILRADPKLWGHAIFRPKNDPFALKDNLNLVALSIYMQKIRVRCQSINEILTIKEYWNLIGREHFWPWLENLIFPTCVVFAEC